MSRTRINLSRTRIDTWRLRDGVIRDGPGQAVGPIRDQRGSAARKRGGSNSVFRRCLADRNECCFGLTDFEAKACIKPPFKSNPRSRLLGHKQKAQHRAESALDRSECRTELLRYGNFSIKLCSGSVDARTEGKPAIVFLIRRCRPTLSVAAMNLCERLLNR